MKLPYLIMDVFTRTPLSGNPLCVVMKADKLTDGQMQAIAAEFNLSETVFVRRPKDERHVAELRIFTPSVELPFAGHPTVGAAVALALQQRLSAVRMEEKVGLVTAIADVIDARRGKARFALPRYPEAAGDAPPVADMARVLGIAPEEIGCGAHVPSVYDAGVLFYLVPVRDASVLARLKPERRGMADVFRLGHNAVYAFTETPDEPDADLAARMFAPGMGIAEDPATGGAAAALIGALAAASTTDGVFDLVIRQGREIGRPSRIDIHFKIENGQLAHAAIGGEAVIVAEGTLNIGMD